MAHAPAQHPGGGAAARADGAGRQVRELGIERRRDRGGAVGRTRPVRRLADDQIENHGCRDNRNTRSGRALPEYGEAPAAQFQLSHGAVGRGEPERGAAAQHDGVDALDGVIRLQ